MSSRKSVPPFVHERSPAYRPAVLSASPDHVQIRFGPHDIPQRTSYLGSAVSDQFGFGRREHSRKHSRHYGSVKPRAADRFASASGFPERRISRNPRVHPVVIRLTASRSATVGMELWERVSLSVSLFISLFPTVSLVGNVTFATSMQPRGPVK